MKSEPVSQADPTLVNHQKYMEALRACDVATIVSLYCEDAVFMPPNEPSFFGRAEVKEWYDEYFQHFQIAVFSQTERDVTILNGWAVERWAYMISIAPVVGGERIRDDGRSLIVWRRDADGVWRMSHRIMNSIRPVGSGTSRFISKMMEEKKKKR